MINASSSELNKKRLSPSKARSADGPNRIAYNDRRLFQFPAGWFPSAEAVPAALKQDEGTTQQLSDALLNLRLKTKYCKICHIISDSEDCTCESLRKDKSILCVVEDTPDVIAIQNTSQFFGYFHVLGSIATQARLSRVPRRGRLLAETLVTREGHHLFVYPFAGRNVHIGLAQLLAWRLARTRPTPSRSASTTTGWRSSPRSRWTWRRCDDGTLFGTDGLLADVLASLNSGALAQRRFREIARVAGPGVQRLPRRAQEHASSCRRRAACSSRSSATTTPATGCSARPSRRCWRRSWSSTGWARCCARMAAARSTWSSCPRPAPSACR